MPCAILKVCATGVQSMADHKLASHGHSSDDGNCSSHHTHPLGVDDHQVERSEDGASDARSRFALNRRGFLSLAIPGLILGRRAFGQGSADMAERFRKMSEDAERAGLAEPFKGITTDGRVTSGLFPIQSTGVSTEPVRNAAEKLFAALTPEQRARTMFPVDDPEWRKWMNQHFYVRQGVSFKEMNESQRDAAFGLLRSSLSARGVELTRNIMRLNETLAELTNDHEFLGEWLYHITV